MADAFDGLPLFATDHQIATAIVGKARAQQWLNERLPTLAAKPGFPPVDAFHGGRPVALVRKFYEHYLHLVSPAEAPGKTIHDGPEGSWEPKRSRGAHGRRA